MYVDQSISTSHWLLNCSTGFEPKMCLIKISIITGGGDSDYCVQWVDDCACDMNTKSVHRKGQIFWRQLKLITDQILNGTESYCAVVNTVLLLIPLCINSSYASPVLDSTYLDLNVLAQWIRLMSTSGVVGKTFSFDAFIKVYIIAIFYWMWLFVPRGHQFWSYQVYTYFYPKGSSVLKTSGIHIIRREITWQVVFLQYYNYTWSLFFRVIANGMAWRGVKVWENLK